RVFWQPELVTDNPGVFPLLYPPVIELGDLLGPKSHALVKPEEIIQKCRNGSAIAFNHLVCDASRCVAHVRSSSNITVAAPISAVKAGWAGYDATGGASDSGLLEF